MKIYIPAELDAARFKLIYFFTILGINKGVNIECVFSSDRNAPSVGIDSDSTIKISTDFINNKLSKENLNKDCLFEFENKEPDYVGTAFFMLTSMQEYDQKILDELNRFRYTDSYQYNHGNVKKNIVQKCFDATGDKLGLPRKNEKTKFFLSHDIDSVYGGILEDGFNVLKKGRIDLFLAMLIRTATVMPDWLNIDKIVKMESEYDCKSSFFWIVNKGKINKREKNADYTFRSRKIQHHFQLVENSGFENGLHKSISSESFSDEIKKYGSRPLANRYHYLKFNLPAGFSGIDEASLKLDASLGFAEETGFRNSYGLPYNPYDFANDRPYHFVEMPLHIMDRTYFQYKKFNTLDAWRDIFSFFEQNKENCVLSILWHNNFFTNYKFKGYLDLYKKILVYIKENNSGTITQQEIIKKYSIISNGY